MWLDNCWMLYDSRMHMNQSLTAIFIIKCSQQLAACHHHEWVSDYLRLLVYDESIGYVVCELVEKIINSSYQLLDIWMTSKALSDTGTIRRCFQTKIIVEALQCTQNLCMPNDMCTLPKQKWRRKYLDGLLIGTGQSRLLLPFTEAEVANPNPTDSYR